MMYKKLLILFCVLIGISSCYQYKKPDKPKNLISKDEMVYILIDLKLIGAVTGRDKAVLDSAKVVPESYIYKKYNIDSTQFAKSNAYYTFYMDEYAEIYKRVKDSLSKLKVHYKKVLDREREEQWQADSLKAAKKELEALEMDTEIGTEEIELIAPVSDND